ncbi:MAG: hypothetical protein OXI81_08145 [Paracoccaceae bacterium]|nr:hypothetical protein [Paracoccaceae bacterium]
MSGSVRIDPVSYGLGLSLMLAPSVGNASSGTGTLWSAADARGLAPGGTFEAGRRHDTEVGYGFAVFGDRFTGASHAGLSLSEGGWSGLRDRPRRHPDGERQRQRRAGARVRIGRDGPVVNGQRGRNRKNAPQLDRRCRGTSRLGHPRRGFTVRTSAGLSTAHLASERGGPSAGGTDNGLGTMMIGRLPPEHGMGLRVTARRQAGGCGFFSSPGRPARARPVRAGRTVPGAFRHR